MWGKMAGISKKDSKVIYSAKLRGINLVKKLWIIIINQFGHIKIDENTKIDYSFEHFKRNIFRMILCALMWAFQIWCRHVSVTSAVWHNTWWCCLLLQNVLRYYCCYLDKLSPWNFKVLSDIFVGTEFLVRVNDFFNLWRFSLSWLYFEYKVLSTKSNGIQKLWSSISQNCLKCR